MKNFYAFMTCIALASCGAGDDAHDLTVERPSLFSPETLAALERLTQLGNDVRALGINDDFFASLEDVDWLSDIEADQLVIAGWRDGTGATAERQLDALAALNGRIDAISGAFRSPCVGDRCGPDGGRRYGAWLAIGEDGNPAHGATVQLRGRVPAYAAASVLPPGTATFVGNARGVGLWTERTDPDIPHLQKYRAGEFTASVMLEYDFEDARLLGAIGNFTGPGADGRWPMMHLGVLSGVVGDGAAGGWTGRYTATPYGPGAGDREPAGWAGTFSATIPERIGAHGGGEVHAGFDAIASGE